jgi:hypothetical protein
MKIHHIMCWTLLNVTLCVTELLVSFLIYDFVKWMLSFQPTLEEDHHDLQFMHTSFIYIATETDNHSSDDTLHFVGAVGACWSQQASHLRVKRQLEKYMNTSFVDVCGHHSLSQMKCQNSSHYCRMSTLLWFLEPDWTMYKSELMTDQSRSQLTWHEGEDLHKGTV